MTDKEQLEEINQRVLDMKRKSGMPIEVLTWQGWKEVAVLLKEDYKYLREQAERVQELEQKIRVDSELFEMQVQQNKRYREAIEETLRAFGLIEQLKYGNRLKKALEGDDDE